MLIFRIKLGVKKWQEQIKCRKILKKSLKQWRNLKYPRCIYYTVESNKVCFNVALKQFYSKEFETEKGAKDFFEILKKYLKRKFLRFDEAKKPAYYNMPSICWEEMSDGSAFCLILKH